jgi:sialidase-1
MKHLCWLILILLFDGCFSSPSDDLEIALRNKPFFEIQMLFGAERFPNIVVAKDGTIIALWGKEKVVSKRSTDAGATWEDEVLIDEGIHGGGLVVDDASGDLIAFVEKGVHPPAPLASFRSVDQGRSWQPNPIQISPDNMGNLPSMHMNEHGICLKNEKYSGRLVRATRFYSEGNDRKYWPNHYTNAIYSDDGGHSWQTSNPFPANGTGEAAIVELENGTLYYNTRRHLATDSLNPRRRHIATSTDGGNNWKNLYVSPVLPDGEKDRDYGLMAGLDRLPFAGKDLLIFSNIDSDSGRKNGKIWLSFDGGKSWPVQKTIDQAGFKYSSMAVGRKNTPSQDFIYLLYETGTKENVNAYGGGKLARFNLSWLLQDIDVNQYLN